VTVQLDRVLFSILLRGTPLRHTAFGWLKGEREDRSSASRDPHGVTFLIAAGGGPNDVAAMSKEKWQQKKRLVKNFLNLTDRQRKPFRASEKSKTVSIFQKTRRLGFTIAYVNFG